MNSPHDYDYVVIGSGFGGSVSALRLSEKGYKVLVLEKGKWLKEKDFPKTNWQLTRWMWAPFARCFGLFKLTYFRHVAVLSGVGVGGGSLVYANTLPVPKKRFFQAESWAHLADWEGELQPFYKEALRMLGATTAPRKEAGDKILQEIAKDLGKEDHFEPTRVAVYFGEKGKTAKDPYFDGKGPERSGCTFCGGCMLGCRYNAKNTLDKNYLHLARGLGAEIQAESEVYDIQPLGAEDGSEGYRVFWRSSTKFFKKKGSFTCKGLVFSGGVLGSVGLLLKLKDGSLPRLSEKVGHGVRTNSESLIGVSTFDKNRQFSDGVAISSILHTDEYSHMEPVRYSAGSGFWRLFMAPLVSGGNVFVRMAKMAADYIKHPVANFKAHFVDDWSKRTQILLFMQNLDSTLRFVRGPLGMSSKPEEGPLPSAFLPHARDLAERFAKKANGKTEVLISETLLGIPTTAHILGGANMGADAGEGVIDKNNHVFGYQNMLVCDGSMISANPGVNPSLTITAISERAMSLIPEKDSENKKNVDKLENEPVLVP